jgi:hypothetical protein
LKTIRHFSLLVVVVEHLQVGMDMQMQLLVGLLAVLITGAVPQEVTAVTVIHLVEAVASTVTVEAGQVQVLHS